jgi:DNA primase
MADQVIQDIKDRLNLAEVISGYIQIKKAGTSFKALCPFHHEKTPSLQISPQKQIWHCFGCGEGGDVFGFVMRHENLEFREALKLLADKAGVQLPTFRPRDPKEQSDKELFLRINDFAARFYHQFLTKEKKGGEALEYLKNRGLTAATIKQWQIGFAPNDFHSLEEALKKKSVDLGQATRAGVLIRGEKGQVYPHTTTQFGVRVYDRFRGRITFPIFDYLGQIVGFSARILPTLDDGKTGKYINSPETLIYNKSKILFGLNFAKDAIHKKDEAVVVEGQMDCLAAHQSGFTNTVATSGTALTSQQLDTLGRLTKNLKFCFDADSAGYSAARRAGELALQKGFRLKVIQLTEAKDPDELIKKSPQLWEKAVSRAMWFLDFYILLAEEKFGQDPVAQKHYLSSEVVPFLGFIADALEQDHYINTLVKTFGVSERVIRQQIAAKGQRLQPAILGPTAPVAAKPAVLEKEILGGMLFDENFLRLVLQEGQISDFEDPLVILELKSAFTAKDALGLNRDSTLAKESLFMVESFLDEAEGNREIVLKQLKKSFAVLKLNAIKREQGILSLEINRAERVQDKQKLTALNEKFAQAAVLRMKYEKLM